MAYATIADVQARIPIARLTLGSGSEPSSTLVQTWLDASSAWIDAGLADRYAVPVTDETDASLLREVCANLAAARVWNVLDGATGATVTGLGAELRREALQLLAHSPLTGRSEVLLRNTPPAGTSTALSAADTGTAGAGEDRLFLREMAF